MTGEVINLRRARKQRARAKKRAAGDANAAAHGRSGAEKALTAALEEQNTRRLEGHRRAPGDSDSKGDAADE